MELFGRVNKNDEIEACFDFDEKIQRVKLGEVNLRNTNTTLTISTKSDGESILHKIEKVGGCMFGKRDIHLLMSQLQKCVRRFKVKLGVRTAKTLMEIDGGYLALLRRLPVIMWEDSGIHKSFVGLVWLMIVSGKNLEYLSWKKGKNWVLGIVKKICEMKTNHTWVGKLKHIRPVLKFGEKPVNDVSKALLVRIAFGGMKKDLYMMERSVEYWNKNYDMVDKSTVEIVEYSTISCITKNDIMRCAADFHCLPRLLSEVVRRRRYLEEDDLRKAMWYFSSGINKRYDIHALERTNRYKRLWEEEKTTIRNIALELLNK